MVFGFSPTTLGNHVTALRRVCLENSLDTSYKDHIEEFVCSLYRDHLNFGITPQAEIKYMNYLTEHVWQMRNTSKLEENLSSFFSDIIKKFSLKRFNLVLNDLKGILL